MTEQTSNRHTENDFDVWVQDLVDRVVQRTTRFVEQTAGDTTRLADKIERASEKARRQAERAEQRAARLNEKIQQRAERGRPPRMEDELRNVGLEIERQALLAVQSALRDVEQHLGEIDVEAITRRVEEQFASMDVEGISRQTEETLRKASVQIQQAAERRGYTGSGGEVKPEPVSDEERLAVLQMVQSGTITAEEAEKLLNALEGAKG